MINWCGYTWDCKMDGGRIIHPSHPHYWYSDADEVVHQAGDELQFRFRNNPKHIKHWDGKWYNPTYEMGLLRTKEQFSFGTFSLEAWHPLGKDFCVAFWLSGSGNWPPEIDIVESWPGDSLYSCKTMRQFPWILPSWSTTTNVHYNNNSLQHHHIGSKNVLKLDQPLDPCFNWIEYKVKWEPDKISFYMNDVLVRTVSKKYANMLINNLKNPDKGYLMNVIIDICPEDPENHNPLLTTPLIVRKFSYKPL